MTGKRRNRLDRERQRLRKKRQNTTQALGFLAKELPGVDPAAIPIVGILRAFRAAMTAPLHPDVQAEVLRRLALSLEKAFVSMVIKAADFGLKDAQALAELFLTMLLRTDYAAYSAKELRRVKAGQYSRTPGLRSVFAGEFFELIVQNLTGLQTELRSLAQELLTEMDAIVKGTATGRPPLLTADGTDLNLQGTFGRVQKLTDIVELVEGSAPLKFIDFMYVAVFTPADGSPKRLAILLESEFKLPGAARQLRKQVGKALGRLTTGKGIAGILDDAEDVSFERENLIFSRTALTPRTAISPGATEGYRWVTTDKGGYPESYLHVKAAIDVDELYRVVNLLFSNTTR